MNALASALQLTGLLVLPALAVIFFTMALLGTVDRRTPRCGHCGETLTFIEVARTKPCRACGNTASDRAPVPARRRPAWRILLVACTLLVVAAPTAWLGHALRLRPVAFVPSLASLPTAMSAPSSSAREVDATVDAVRRGEFSTAELRAGLLKHIESGTVTVQPPATLRLAALALEDPGASAEDLDEYWSTILASVMPPASPARIFLITNNPSLVLDPTREPSADSEIGRVAVLRRAWIDDVEVDLKVLLAHRLSADEPLMLPLSIRAFDAGPHTLRVSLETFLYPRFDLERIGVHASPRLLEKDWPMPLARGVVDSSLTFTTQP